ncbi:hypothetical protein D9M68_475030 [compost metagenome]
MKVPVYIIIVCFLACRPESPKQEQTGNTALPPKTLTTRNECYRYIKGKDTVTLSLLTAGTGVSGRLQYKWFEKDRSTGSLEGKMYGDTLLATYTFDAEGQRSVREVAFLKKEQQVIEGFGPVEDKNGKQRFKNFRKLDFNSTLILDKVPCP